ncbi:Protein TANC1 [Bienertia sinuspersici]
MASLEFYEKLDREINHLFAERGCLIEEDVLVRELKEEGNSLCKKRKVDNALEKYRYVLVRELKEEGNSLYKQRKVDDALEKYGYIGVHVKELKEEGNSLYKQRKVDDALEKYSFVEEKDRVEFYELAIFITLNSTTCLG